MNDILLLILVALVYGVYYRARLKDISAPVGRKAVIFSVAAAAFTACAILPAYADRIWALYDWSGVDRDDSRL